MSVAIITGSCGLIGSEAVRFFSGQGFQTVGVDNNMRAYFFGEQGSTDWSRKSLEKSVPGYKHVATDIRDQEAIDKLFAGYGKDCKLVIHTAAQPSHDWAAREPFTDFSVNATGTLVLLEAVRKHCPEAVFIFTSTNKVYGDTPNYLPLEENESRFEVETSHPYSSEGIPESMSIDQCKHSLFGASKVAADVLVQEYGRYFDMHTGIFRGGCLTGPGHSGAELHGFLSYLVLCAVKDIPYTIFGYKGKQVRDHIHSADLISMFWHFFQKPRIAEVYNTGGSRHSNCSVLEAVALLEKKLQKKMQIQYDEKNRIGDHIWWISDVRKFRSHYPDWGYSYGLDEILNEIIQAMQERA